MDFEWLIIDDGSTDNTQQLVDEWIKIGKIPIRYIYKENGGLYTGYNTAFSNIETELSVCVDSDDFMPDNAVELIVNHWRKYGSDKYVGITGLDFTLDGHPIGGMFDESLFEAHIIDMKHPGDAKQVFRTNLVKALLPMEGFENEKNFNPHYLYMLLDNDYPSLILNKNLCFVEYQEADSMSAGIFRQYLNSPRSFAKMRIAEMNQRHTNWKNLIRVAIHYSSSCFIYREKDWLKKSPKKVLTLLCRPLGWMLSKYIKYKAKE